MCMCMHMCMCMYVACACACYMARGILSMATGHGLYLSTQLHAHAHAHADTHDVHNINMHMHAHAHAHHASQVPRYLLWARLPGALPLYSLWVRWPGAPLLTIKLTRCRATCYKYTCQVPLATSYEHTYQVPRYSLWARIPGAALLIMSTLTRCPSTHYARVRWPGAFTWVFTVRSMNEYTKQVPRYSHEYAYQAPLATYYEHAY